MASEYVLAFKVLVGIVLFEALVISLFFAAPALFLFIL